MNIERIDDLHVVFNGVKFKKDRRSGYYWSVNIPRKSLHLSVFEFHGNIRPEKFELHHIDFNKENNDISNIACLSITDHKNIHTDHRRKKYGKNWNSDNIKKAQDGLREWRKTSNYKKWLLDTKEQRKEWARKSHESREVVTLICDICGKEFIGYKKRKNKICSNKCNAKRRRDLGLDNVSRKCVICNKDFISNKNQKTKTCSNKCRAIYGYSNRGKSKKSNL